MSETPSHSGSRVSKWSSYFRISSVYLPFWVGCNFSSSCCAENMDNQHLVSAMFPPPPASSINHLLQLLQKKISALVNSSFKNLSRIWQRPTGLPCSRPQQQHQSMALFPWFHTHQAPLLFLCFASPEPCFSPTHTNLSFLTSAFSLTLLKKVIFAYANLALYDFPSLTSVNLWFCPEQCLLVLVSLTWL